MLLLCPSSLQRGGKGNDIMNETWRTCLPLIQVLHACAVLRSYVDYQCTVSSKYYSFDFAWPGNLILLVSFSGCGQCSVKQLLDLQLCVVRSTDRPSVRLSISVTYRSCDVCLMHSIELNISRLLSAFARSRLLTVPTRHPQTCCYEALNKHHAANAASVPHESIAQ